MPVRLRCLHIVTSSNQPLLIFNYTHVNVGYDGNVPAGGLFAGGITNWLV